MQLRPKHPHGRPACHMARIHASSHPWQLSSSSSSAKHMHRPTTVMSYTQAWHAHEPMGPARAAMIRLITTADQLCQNQTAITPDSMSSVSCPHRACSTAHPVSVPFH